MKRFNGFEAKRSAAREILPAGGYVAKIMGAEELHYDWGDVLLISFDIAEGDYRDFFAADYRSQQQEDKKWRGTYRLTIPNDNGDERDAWAKRRFGNAIWAIEESNGGYRWDWNEAALKGKLVGVLYRNKEWEMNGMTGWTTECCQLTSIDEIRSNKFKIPKDRPLAEKNSQASSRQSADSFSEVVDDLPF